MLSGWQGAYERAVASFNTALAIAPPGSAPKIEQMTQPDGSVVDVQVKELSEEEVRAMMAAGQDPVRACPFSLPDCSARL